MSKTKTPKVIVITGASSGIGLATANYLLGKGYIVYGIARSSATKVNAAFHYYQGDIGDSQQMQQIASEIYTKEGRIDILYNNAGFGISGAVEFADKEHIQKQFDVNVVSTIDMCRIYLPYIRESKGKILFTTSVAAPAAIPLQACYSATKAALESFALALSKEVRRQGVKVACIRPGDIQTGFTDARVKNMQTNDAYGDFVKSKTEQMEKSERKGMQPIAVAKHVYRVCARKNPPLISTVGFGYKCVSGLLKIVPVRWSNYLVYKLY